METKVCKHCGRELPIEDFATFRGKPTCICKECKSKKMAENARKRYGAADPAENTRKAEAKKTAQKPSATPFDALTWEDVRDIVMETDMVLETTSKRDLLLNGESWFYTRALCNVIRSRS